MPDEPLFTLRELADQLSLPESTVRYYRDAFLDHIPSVGTGRRRRYPPAALAVLRSIAKGYSSGLSHAEILGRMDGPPAAPVAEPVAGAPKPRRRSAASETAEVTNLDLLAAIVDGEREQREALWQMAQEIVRLTGVLENQEKVLTEIGEHTGFTIGAGEPHPYLTGDLAAPPALGRGAAEPTRAAPFASAPAPAPEPPSEPRAAPAPAPSWILDPSPQAVSASAASLESAPRPSLGSADPSEIERLRQELDSERQLVDRLRESKLKLEQRTAEAEGAVEENRVRRRSSVLGRFLKADRDEP
jgi:DNA-binding transcriptional MerR regulator